MLKFKLLVGKHVGPDYSKKPVVMKDDATGRTTKKYPSKIYKAGDIVEDKADLCETLGYDKFEYYDAKKALAKRRSRTDHSKKSSPAELVPYDDESLEEREDQADNAEQDTSAEDRDEEEYSSEPLDEEDAEADSSTSPSSDNSANNRKITSKSSSKPSDEEDEESMESEESSEAEDSDQEELEEEEEEIVLETMTTRDLRQYAAERDIDISDARTKSQMITTIRHSQA